MAYVCNLCGRKFKSNKSLLEHIMKYHVGKLSEESIEYLKSLGIPDEKIQKWL